jgi:hypothetical protein
MLHTDSVADPGQANAVSGDFVTVSGERWYAIHNADRMAPFFVSVISNVDHWLFVSSAGGLTAGRVSPDTALFPYITVDKIHDAALYTGPRTLLRAGAGAEAQYWEPFNREHDGRFQLTRNIYKNVLGNKLRFEEVNHDLQLAFRYTWLTSDEYGFVRHCELENLGGNGITVEMVDGVQNILPAGTPRFTQTNSSNLVDAYKWTELDTDTGLALFTLYSGITDRAEPCESLRANALYCLGLEAPVVLISSQQLDDFRGGRSLHEETHKRGIRGAYFVNQALELPPKAACDWQIVAATEQSQAQVVSLRRRLRNGGKLADAIAASVERGSDELARIMAMGDGFQSTAEENVSVHHYANVLFNVLRGGYFFDQYRVSSHDFGATIRQFNLPVYTRNESFLAGLPDHIELKELLGLVEQQGDPQLERLCREYLPITFGRRHGDPSRPWNQFSIRLKDEAGDPLLSYEGNWRDIFQNWEALTFSYPEFVENVIAKFVNASTIDGYNPYRITKEGIDWEVEEPDDPWSYIGYWGDHQIIYLLKLLELSRHFHPSRLEKLLRKRVFSYANVPYRIKPFDKLFDDPKSTVLYDDHVAERIERLVETLGADGKLLLNAGNEVYQVNLLEKLLVPLLAKLGNLVVGGGIWLNTQRPEWNDANNALVGQGLSMVTLYYMRRYVCFLRDLLADESDSIELSPDVGLWLTETASALGRIRPSLNGQPLSDDQRYAALRDLGQAASRFRQAVYRTEAFTGLAREPLGVVKSMLDDALAVIDYSIGTNRRDDGLYHAYNVLGLQNIGIHIDRLYPMLEGQVAALSSGAIAPEQAADVLEALFDSSIYREDQQSFMLYPDRELPGFLARNRIPASDVEAIPLLPRMLANGDERLVVQDADGDYRFNSDFTNVGDLDEALDLVADAYGEELEAARQPLRDLYEQVFNHKEFTGRSGTMFGFEGLGCIYWHMVSKLLLAVQENFFAALENGAEPAVCQRLGELYYRVRAGIGFNKTPSEYGAFPTDPYSHTPRHSGAKQPGMTGQVKEEVLTRFGELGVRVTDGVAHIRPSLLRAREFLAEPGQLCYLDIEGEWQSVDVPGNALAFTWCQVPVIYRLDDSGDTLTITRRDGSLQTFEELTLPAEESRALFARSGELRQLTVTFNSERLFAE